MNDSNDKTVESIFAVELTEAELDEVAGAEPVWQSRYMLICYPGIGCGGGYTSDMQY